jgi:hypothetical protein
MDNKATIFKNSVGEKINNKIMKVNTEIVSVNEEEQEEKYVIYDF